MPSTYANNLRLENIANGEQSGSWGDTTNKNICSLLVDSIAGVVTTSITGLTTYTLSAYNGVIDESRNAVLQFTGNISADCTIYIPAVGKTYLIDNYTNVALAKQNLIIRTTAGAVAATVPFGIYTVYCGGVDTFISSNLAKGGAITGNLAITGNETVTGTLGVAGVTTLASSLTGVLSATAGVVSAVAPGDSGNILASNGTAWASTTPVFVSSLSGGTTGLTPATATTGAVVLAGTLAVASGGTGVTTKTGTGAVVLGTSPVLTTPTLTTPTFNTASMPTVVGTAPLYMARAWVSFSGRYAFVGVTPTAAAIRGQGNVTSVGSNAGGQFFINFNVAMPDVNYALLGTMGTSMDTTNMGMLNTNESAIPRTSSTVYIGTLAPQGSSPAWVDPIVVDIVAYR